MMARLRHAWRSFMGWEDCPLCGEQCLQWHKVHIYHPDEPPMFGWWHCTACDAATEVLPTSLMDNAAKSFGYRDFKEFAEVKLTKREPNTKEMGVHDL